MRLTDTYGVPDAYGTALAAVATCGTETAVPFRCVVDQSGDALRD